MLLYFIKHLSSSKFRLSYSPHAIMHIEAQDRLDMKFVEALEARLQQAQQEQHHLLHQYSMHDREIAQYFQVAAYMTVYLVLIQCTLY